MMVCINTEVHREKELGQKKILRLPAFQFQDA